MYTQMVSVASILLQVGLSIAAVNWFVTSEASVVWLISTLISRSYVFIYILRSKILFSTVNAKLLLQ